MAHSNNAAQTAEIALGFIDKVAEQPRAGAAIIGLVGDLGAGKTTFVQAVAKHLGISETVTSPTYVIEKIYKLKHEHFEHLIHIDAYRLEKSAELVNLGWKEIAANPKNLIFIEWPERVEDILPKKYVKILFKHISENERDIAII